MKTLEELLAIFESEVIKFARHYCKHSVNPYFKLSF